MLNFPGGFCVPEGALPGKNMMIIYAPGFNKSWQREELKEVLEKVGVIRSDIVFPEYDLEQFLAGMDDRGRAGEVNGFKKMVVSEVSDALQVVLQEVKGTAGKTDAGCFEQCEYVKKLYANLAEKREKSDNPVLNGLFLEDLLVALVIDYLNY